MILYYLTCEQSGDYHILYISEAGSMLGVSVVPWEALSFVEYNLKN
jgi:hypothetical protein